MKKLLIIMLWMFLGVSSTMAQWAELTTGTTVNLNGLQFTDNNHGFCIGDGGIFLHTNDGGSTWNTKTFFTSENFQKLHFVNNNLGFICSDNHLYKTTDGGANFTEITNLLQHPDTPTKIMDNISISFTDSVGVIRALWLGDTSISFKTINGGFSWQPFLIPIASSNNVVDFSIINSNIIYAIASNIQYKTIDAGVTWVSIRNLPYSIVGDNPFQVFDTTGIGFANCAYGTAFVRFYSDVSDTAIVNGMIFDPHSISFINADTGYLLKYDKIYKTINGGITKTIIDSFTAWRPDHVFFLNNEIGFICGQNGKIYKTTNGGTTSIQNPSLKKKLKIYPNPTSEKINLEYENDFSIESIQLLDISGKFIKSFKKNEKVLNVSGLPNGMYYLNIKAKEESAIEKIVIE